MLLVVVLKPESKLGLTVNGMENGFGVTIYIL